METHAIGKLTKRRLKYLLPLVALLPLLLTGCPTPNGGSGSTVHYLNGTLRDAVTGDPLSGLSVNYASFAPVTTGADGKLSFNLGTGGGTVIGPLTISGAGIRMVYSDGISCSADITSNVNIYISTSGTKPTHQVKITVNDATPAEIPNGTSLQCYILNNTGVMYMTGGSYATGGYTVTTPTFGSDCLVAVTGSIGSTFVAMARQVDLSGAVTNVTVTQDASPATAKTVTVTGDAAGNIGVMMYATPYGKFPFPQFNLSGIPATASVMVSNPYNYDVSWGQAQYYINFLGGPNTKVYECFALPETLSSIATLPAVTLTLGPNSLPSAASLNYDTMTHTLSIDPVTDVNVHLFRLTDPITSAILADIITTHNSVAIPSSLAAQLSGLTVTVTCLPIDSATGLTIDFLWLCSINNISFSELRGIGMIPNAFSKSLTF